MTYPAQSHANLYQCNAMCICGWKGQGGKSFLILAKNQWCLYSNHRNSNLKNFDCEEKMSSETDWNSLLLFLFICTRIQFFTIRNLVNIRHLCEGTFQSLHTHYNKHTYTDFARKSLATITLTKFHVHTDAMHCASDARML